MMASPKEMGRQIGKDARRDASEDLHFRLDEHERVLDQIGQAIKPECIAAVVQGAVAALHASMQAQTEKLLSAVREDVQTDKDVVAAVCELIETMKRPVRRTTTLNLPSGPVTVTTEESR